MSNDVFANGREIACKAANGKSTCSFPDVCFTPPQTPATPPGVPVPYPNTAFAKDTDKGSKSVKISGKEILLKNKSYFKKSVGDEAGRASKKGLVTSKEEGKGYFHSWSPNVKVEKKNVTRHFDILTQNHGSFPGNTPTWPYVDSSDFLSDSTENPKCKCCGRDAHSTAQAQGNEITEEEFYSGHPDGSTWLKMARDEGCGHLVPPEPPLTDDSCAKYYRGIISTKGPRADFSETGANPLSNPNSLPYVYKKGKMAHKVPLAAGGCPVGEGNLAPVGDDPNCKALEDMSSEIHNACMKAWQ